MRGFATTVLFAATQALLPSVAHTETLDAFDNPDFELTSEYGPYDAYTEIGRGFGYNGNGGARISGFLRHSFALPVKTTLHLQAGERYVFSLDTRSASPSVIEQIAFEVYDKATGKYDHGYWGRTSADIGSGWRREELAFVPRRDLDASTDRLRFIVSVQLDASLPEPTAETYVDCDNAVLRTDEPLWYFCNTWPTHNKVFNEEGRLRAYSSFVGSFLPADAQPSYALALLDETGGMLAEAAAEEASGVLTAAFGRIPYEGPATLVCSLYDRGRLVGTRSRDVTVAPTYVPKKGEVFIDELGRALVDGKPFMPLGFYSSFNPTQYSHDYTAEHLRRIAAEGFNVLIDYSTYLMTSKAERDFFYGTCAELGIRVLATDFAGYQQKPDRLSEIGPKALELAQYPALIGWYTMDEASEDKVPVLDRIRRELNRVTPGHVVLTCNIMEPAPYLPTADVQGGDKYPIDRGEGVCLRSAEAYMRRAGACRPAAAWHAPQWYNWANGRRGALESPEAYDAAGREPTANEMLSVALAYAANGMTGFTFYSYFDHFKGPYPERVETRWQDMCAVGRAMRDLEPCLTSGLVRREIPVTNVRGESRAVALSDGKGGSRVLVYGLDCDNACTFTLPPEIGRCVATCGNVTEADGVYSYAGREFTCDVLRSPVRVTWVGGSGDWSDATCWRSETGANFVPDAGDDVVIAGDAAVTLDRADALPALGSLTVGGGTGVSTLLVTNWNAALVATSVTVAARGVITCRGALEKKDMGRVWIRCEDLTVDAGGKIDVDFCGYLSHEKSTVSTTLYNGYGPGKGQQYGMGASHGGLGGLAVYSGASNPLTMRKPDFSDMLYDDPAAPVEPGSSGRSSYWSRGGFGGGAVRIEATGRVTVNGSILASGQDQGNTSRYSLNSHGTAGSGGSVYITSRTFAGTNGVIRADGGKGHYAINRRKDAAGNWLNSVIGYDYPDDFGDSCGGGGMIAIHYDADSQGEGLVRGMTISASPGAYPEYYSCKGPTRANDDRYAVHGGLGTLHFTDGKMLESLGKGLTGRILGFSEWTCDSLEFTGGYVQFDGEGFRLKVKGDLTVSGTDVRLDLGCVAMTNRVFRPEVWAGRQTVKLEVGGDLTVTGGARLDIRAAETNAANALGASVTVGKTLTVGKDGWLYSWCDPVGGASPLFTVSNLTVAAGGRLTAEGRGFAGAAGRDNGEKDRYWNHRTVGYGPTPGFGKWGSSWEGLTFPDGTTTGAPATGGSHGGLGGLSSIAAGNNVKYAKTGDSLWRPVQPGSGGGADAMSLGNGAGGGVIRVEAEDHIQVDGEINADAGWTWSRSGAASGGAGGTIFLSSRTFAGAATGVLTARGGDINHLATVTPETSDRRKASGAGGGGRIAVWTGEAYPGRITSRRIGKYEAAADCPGCDYLGLATATGGTNITAKLSVEAGVTLNGGDGTVRFAHVGPPQGMGIVIR